MIAYMEKNENCKENRFLSMDSLKKNSRFYLVAAFLAAAILALLCVGNGIWKEYRNSAVRNQKDQMLLAVESLSGRLEETISEYASDIRSMWSCSHTLNALGYLCKRAWSCSPGCYHQEKRRNHPDIRYRQ